MDCRYFKKKRDGVGGIFNPGVGIWSPRWYWEVLICNFLSVSSYFSIADLFAMPSGCYSEVTVLLLKRLFPWGFFLKERAEMHVSNELLISHLSCAIYFMKVEEEASDIVFLLTAVLARILTRNSTTKRCQ